MRKRIVGYGLTVLLIGVLLIRNTALNQTFTTWDTILLGILVVISVLFIAVDLSFWLPFGKTIITGVVFIGFIALMFEYDWLPIEGGAIIILPAIVLLGTAILLNIIYMVSKPFRR